MDRLNFNHLYYFYVVAREGSIKGAAEKLFVSQPTISDQIRLLEEFFGQKLFERKNRSLHLTKSGQLAAQYAQSIFDQGLELTMRLRNNLQIPKETIDVGITNSMSQYIIYENILPLFGQETMVKIKENQRHLLLAELEEGNLDIIISDNKDGVGSHLKTFRIGMNKTYMLAHKKYQKHKKSFPHHCDEIPFFQYTTESLLRFEIELFFAKYGLSPKIIGEADDIDLMQLICEKGLGSIIVPEVAKKKIGKNKDIIVLGEVTELQTTVWGISKKDLDPEVLGRLK